MSGHGSDRSPGIPSPEEDAAETAARLVLLTIPTIGPARTSWLLGSSGAVAVLERLERGLLPEDLGAAPSGVTAKLIAQWRTQCRKADRDALMARHRELGIGILPPWDPRWPFDEEPDPPSLLFFKGDPDLLETQPAVAVVGTRRCTTVGRTVAYQMGQDLAAASVAVVSGLALGVDGAAHRGCADRGGEAIGVVGSGLDVVYPGGNRVLWDEVAATGLLLSEAPAGAKPARWRFPARNRLIASLADAVVVVESHNKGGSLLTADEAIDRGRPVLAVPGSVLSSASDGTNQLLFEGAVPVRDAADVLDHLGASPSVLPSAEGQLELLPADVEPQKESSAGSASGGHDEPPELESLILREAEAGPVHLDVLVLAAGRPAGTVVAAVQHLVARGQVELDGSTVSRIR